MLFVSRSMATTFHVSLETEFNAVRFINYTILRLCSAFTVYSIVTSKKDVLRRILTYERVKFACHAMLVCLTSWSVAVYLSWFAIKSNKNAPSR